MYGWLWSFGGKRKLIKFTEDKIWVDFDSYLNIKDLNIVMEIYAEKPKCYDMIKQIK